jgi:hypothetical protein
MRDQNRHRRNKTATKKIRSKVMNEVEIFQWHHALDGRDAHDDWVDYIDWLTKGREKGFHPGSCHAPADYRKTRNQTFRAKNKQVIKNMNEEDDDYVFHKYKKDVDWHYF